VSDHWPEPETLPARPPPPPPPDDRRIGSGMLLALAVLALIGLGFLITWLLTRNTSSNAQASTIVITTTTQATTSTNATTASSAPRRPATSTVPDVTKQSEEDGADILVKAGLLPTLSFVPSTDPLGTVEAQAQSPGSTVPYHSHVQINVSRGSNKNPLETIPKLIGDKLPLAVAALNTAGLRLIYVRYAVTDKTKAGTIVQQTPLAGSRAPHNGQVLVYMAAVESG
jgi:hypothetical protein